LDVDNITIDQAAVKSATCKIVSINWLEEVVANEKAVAEKAYLLDAGGAADAADGDDAAADTQSNGKRPTRKAATKAADKTADLSRRWPRRPPSLMRSLQQRQRPTRSEPSRMRMRTMTVTPMPSLPRSRRILKRLLPRL
jgi:hypothetical protein